MLRNFTELIYSYRNCLRVSQYCATVLSIATMTSYAPNKDAPVPLSEIDSWKVYASKCNRLEAPEHQVDDIGGPFETNSTLNEKVSIWVGSITRLQIDAIVNAANNKLLGGGGVDGAIHRAAGPELKDECRTLNGCKTGQAKITRGYNLPAKHVIHTVGPQDKDEALLKSCYQESLLELQKNNLRTIAFPCISTGIYGYPQEKAAKVAILTARKFLQDNGDSVDRIIFCLFLDSDVKIYQDLMQQVFPIETE